GLLHKEYHEKEFSRKGGLFQMVQLWVNLPAKYKMSAPKYQEITHAKMGAYNLHNDKGVIEIIAGEYQGVKGPASTFTPMYVYNARLKKDAEAELSFPANFNTGILVIEGSATINDSHVSTDHFALFKHDGELIQVKTNEDTVLVI